MPASSRQDLSTHEAAPFEVLLGVGMKTLSNCTNQIVGTQLDAG